MKKKVLLRAIAVVLVFSLLPVNASAVEINGWNSRKTSGRGWLENIILSLWDRITGNDEQPGQEKPEETGSDLTLVTDSTTVENGDMLRASTYELTTGNAAAADTTTTLKYFPVTLYDYDTDVINAATHEADIADNATATTWNGLYFSDGTPNSSTPYTKVTPTTFTSLTWAQVQRGTYYANAACTLKAEVKAVQSVSGYSEANATYGALLNTDTKSWTACDGYYYQDGNNYYPLYAKRSFNSYTYYYTYTWGYLKTGDTEVTQLDKTDSVYYVNYYKPESYTFFKANLTTTGYTLVAGSQTLANLSGTDTSKTVGVTLYQIKTSEEVTRTYAAWNYWRKYAATQPSGEKDADNGQKFYTGLVRSTLDGSKNIVFNKPDGGIFNNDSTVKSIYTNVEMPFVYENGTYTFDASQHGVYFHEDATQKSSGKAASDSRLYFNEDNIQNNGGKYADTNPQVTTSVWAPFNDGTSFTEKTMNYHFGMRATIPFTMTPNGRMNANDPGSNAVTFSFSGDDDVWVFIDGKLVIDLGGIHNRLDATIDFAANKVTYTVSNYLKDTYETGSYNEGTNFKLSQTLFNTDTETGLIGQDRVSFAAATEHELTIFYLERGAGSSNCKIEFNLPMKDTVTVSKKITRSYTKDESGEETYSPLTKEEQATVDTIDFGFTLYRSYDGTTFEAVKNLNYSLLNSNGQVISVPSTSSNGHFTLKNGQSARFYGDMGKDGVWYYVVEDALGESFVSPDYTFSGTAAGGFFTDVNNDGADEYYSTADQIQRLELELEVEANKSRVIKAIGSDESADNLTFICENFLNAKLPNPSNLPNEDRIVLDYGLAVEIDVLKNDIWRGDSRELVSISGEGLTVDETTGEPQTPGNELKFGTAEVTDGKVIYHLNKQMTDVEVLNYVVKVTGSEKNEAVGETRTAEKFAVGKVYIIPATVMYYEENFGDLVTYTGSGWEDGYTTEEKYTAEFQEPGVVGTVDDSPYGSDVAYQHDSHDSNGTSKHASTETSAVKFEYTFTGTGTSFFARTGSNTGYMKVTLTNKTTGQVVESRYRDTYYKSEDNVTLYNIPVVTFDGLEYGTYTVTVIVAKKAYMNNDPTSGKIRYHSEFWLDGIRVFNPMDTTEKGVSSYKDAALSAYAADGEANMVNVTVREKLLSEANVKEDGTYEWKDSEGFIVFTDTNGEIKKAEEYRSNGPKEEVYLNTDQSISFSLKNWDRDTNKIYLGLKAPTGNAKVQIGSRTVTLDNAADCCFDISGYAVITTQKIDGKSVQVATFTIRSVSGLVSATNIKVTGSAEFTIIENKEIIGGGDENVEAEILPEELEEEER